MTTSPKRPDVFPEDLINRARSGQLSEGERREFERVLNESAALRVAFQLGRDFDAIDAVCPGDDLLVARLSDRVVSRAQALRTKPRPIARTTSQFRLRASMAAKALLVGSVAVAATWGGRAWVRATQTQVRSPSTVAPAAPATPPQPTPRGASSLGVVGASSSVAAPTSDDQPEPQIGSVHPETLGTRSGRIAAAAPLPNPSSPVPVVPLARPIGDGEDAPALFRRASEARREGRIEQSRLLYVALQARHPESDEARLSHISLAKLLLSSGRAADADTQFAAYLTRRGPLDAEALAGRAECQLRLGQREQERAIWFELLRRFPSSVFAAKARQRSAVLGDDSP
jgi:TolA-binding protein